MCFFSYNNYSLLKYTGISVLLALIFISSPLMAEQKEEDERQPVRISSDLMETVNGSKLVIFKGNVVAVRGGLTIFSDELRIVNFQDTGKIEKMTASGNVRLKYEGRMASADKAIYYNNEERIDLMGNPKVWEGENRISGEVISLFLREDRSLVKGGENMRVEAVYYPSKK